MVVREPLERQFPAAVCSRRRIAGNEAEGKRKEDKEKTIRKDEDKEEKEKPSAGRCALIYSTPLSYPFNVMAA